MRYENVSDIANLKFIHITTPEFESQADNHSTGAWARSQGGHAHKVINRGRELLEFLEELRDRRVTLNGMDFHAHGLGGASRTFGIQLEDSGPGFNYENISHFYDHDLDTVFAAGANIMFYGCEVGRYCSGEYFLTRVGQLLLRSGGGTVKGYRVLGGWHSLEAGMGLEEIPYSHADAEPRDRRTLVTAVVRPNGWTRQIRNPTWLTPNITRARVRRVQDLVDRLYSASSQNPVLRSQLDEQNRFLGRARSRLEGSPSYQSMFEVHDHLDGGMERRLLLQQRLAYPLPQRVCRFTAQGC